MKLWLNVAEGAEYAGVCRDLIYDACAARRMHHIRVGGRRAIRLKREWIDAWLEKHAVGVQDAPVPVSAAAGASARTEVTSWARR
jgi:excisionase family DNA binding protein